MSGIGVMASRTRTSPQPMSCAALACCARGPIRSREVMMPMTSGDDIEVLGLNDVLHAHVGDIIETLKHSGRQHALVVETDPLADKPVIRGVFSASQIARQLGIAPAQGDLTQTFAQIDRAVRLRTMQKNGDSSDGDMGKRQCSQHITPPRQIQQA